MMYDTTTTDISMLMARLRTFAKPGSALELTLKKNVLIEGPVSDIQRVIKQDATENAAGVTLAGEVVTYRHNDGLYIKAYTSNGETMIPLNAKALYIDARAIFGFQQNDASHRS